MKIASPLRVLRVIRSGCLIRRLCAALIVAALWLPLAGCGLESWRPADLLGAGFGQANLSVTSERFEAVELSGSFDRAFYRFDDAQTMTVVLIDGQVDAPSQAATIRLLWYPKAGATPVSPTATNATIQYMIFADAVSADAPAGEVGVYNGAGFVYLRGKPGSQRIGAAVWNGQVEPMLGSAGFNDLLGSALIEGSFSAVRDDAQVIELLDRLSIEVSGRLDFPHRVQSFTPHPGGASAAMASLPLQAGDISANR